MVDVNMDCTNCRFSRPHISDHEEEGPILKCHRYPPVVMATEEEIIQTFPSADEWCGEWSPA